MPAYGLGAATQLVPVGGRFSTAAGRLGLRDTDDAQVEAVDSLRG
jgi:hypothetical protein